MTWYITLLSSLLSALSSDLMGCCFGLCIAESSWPWPWLWLLLWLTAASIWEGFRSLLLWSVNSKRTCTCTHHNTYKRKRTVQYWTKGEGTKGKGGKGSEERCYDWIWIISNLQKQAMWQQIAHKGHPSFYHIHTTPHHITSHHTDNPSPLR